MTPSELAAVETHASNARVALEQLGIPAFAGSQYARELARDVEPLIAAIPALLAEVKRLQAVVDDMHSDAELHKVTTRIVRKSALDLVEDLGEDERASRKFLPQIRRLLGVLEETCAKREPQR